MRTIFITGATSGIGLACVKLFLNKNNIVIGLGRNVNQLKHIKKKFNNGDNNFYGINCDLEKKNVFNQLIKKTSKFKKIDTLINCAGLSFKNKFEKISLKEWNKIMYINVTVPYLLTQKFLNKLSKSKNASIINVSSIAGRLRSVSLGCHYTTSKAAIIGMTRHLAAELSNKKIRVNCCAPSQTITPMLNKSLSPKRQKKLIKNIPLKRLSSSDEQAEVIYFLSSNKSSYVNGSIIDVNGGQL
tara:strand:+ start:2070 stop:2798 length:729 start_codon:yes stop_codon:yes gene_type:complete